MLKLQGYLRSSLFLALPFCFLANGASALDKWDKYEELHKASQNRHSHVPPEAWQLVDPYLMPETHPLKKKLDRLFSKSRVISSQKTLVEAGFEDKKPEPITKIIVTRHRDMPGYMFKIYTDDYLGYHHGEPEYLSFIRRARGAKLVRDEIAVQGWKATFKAPKKWIYALPADPSPLDPSHKRRNFILVEEEMDLLSKDDMKKKWNDGTMTKDDLDKLYFLVTRLGLRGCCKYDNIPICKDGRIAFVDTQSNLRWPIAYGRFEKVLEGPMLDHWKWLTNPEHPRHVPKITDRSAQ